MIAKITGYSLPKISSLADSSNCSCIWQLFRLSEMTSEPLVEVVVIVVMVIVVVIVVDVIVVALVRS